MKNLESYDLKPTTRIIFYYTDNYNRKQSVQTIYSYAKELLIQLLEQEQLDELRDIYYTIGTQIIKADYYNTEL